MPNRAIRVRSLSKRYTLKQSDKSAPPNLWALRDVTFDVPHGAVVGVMGSNGSGKTTLLRILSRITCPTEGRAEITGRLGTVLDMGAGFHGELSGRENVFLNGAVLGMRKTEIARNFDAIVAFAELERFLETPLKRYSTGMCVRLAFAIAAHTESDILLVDEVLSVADHSFQTKCLNKILDAAHEGRTVILVSHDLDFIRQFCTRGIVLERGRVVCDASAPTAVDYCVARHGRPSQNELCMAEPA
jgi:lipopolysaccharide transport system ATP-binding protein